MIVITVICYYIREETIELRYAFCYYRLLIYIVVEFVL